MRRPVANTLQRAGTRRPLVIGIAYGLVVIATTGIIGGTVLVATRDVMLNNEREYLRASAKTAAALVDGDQLSTFTRPDQERSPAYAAAIRPLYAIDNADNAIDHV